MTGHGYPIHVLDATVAAMVAETRPPWLRGLIARHGEPLISRDKQADHDVVDYSWIDQHMSVRIGWTSHETEDGPTRTHYVTAIRGARSEQLIEAEPFTEADISAVVALAVRDDAAELAALEQARPLPAAEGAEATAEIDRLRGIVRDVIALTRSTDGDYLNPEEEIPVGEIQRVLYDRECSEGQRHG